jgi:hypothetical protein
MACELTAGFNLGCLEGIGGVKEVLLANAVLADGSEFMSGVTYDATTGEVLTLPGTAGSVTIYRYVPFRNSGSYTETVQKNLETGTLFFSQEVGWTFGKLAPALRNEFLNIAKARMIVFVRTNDDQILLIGSTEGAQLSAGTVQTGQQKADLMGYQVTVTAENLVPAAHLDAYNAATETPFENFPGITVDPAY